MTKIMQLLCVHYVLIVLSNWTSERLTMTSQGGGKVMRGTTSVCLMILSVSHREDQEHILYYVL